MSTQTPPSAAAPAVAVESPGVQRRMGWLLVVCCVAQFMVILDLSIVNVALPSIQTSLEFSSPALQWVIDAYSITFAGFLMMGGRAADHFGQRRTFVLALVLFSIASLMGGVAPSQGVLVAARALQGLGGALMAASSLAIVTSSFPPGPQLNRAIGTWASMNGLGGAAGVLFGGVITEFLSWRWVLLINPPIGLAMAVLAYRVVVDRRRAKAGDSFDLPGALTLTIGQIVLVFGVVEAGLKGWDTAAALVPIVIGLLLLAVFGVIEDRFASAPLIPFKELTRPLKNANMIVLLFSASLFPMWFVSSLYMQQVLGLSPLHTGLTFLPMTVTIGLLTRRAGKLVSSFGVRTVLGSGLLMMTVGLLLFTRIHDGGSAAVYVMIPGVLTAAGIALSIVPSTIAATQGAKEGQAGLASGLVNTSRQIGGGLGLAVLIILATQRSSDLIGDGRQVPYSLTQGFRLAFVIGAALTAVAALLTFLLVPRPQDVVRSAARKLAVAVAAALLLFVGLSVAFEGSHAPPIGKYVTKDTYKFVTEPTLHPPKIRVIAKSAPASQLAPGYIFTANFFDVNEPPIIGQSGPLILDRSLQPVWFQPVPEKDVASNLSLQSWEGKPALAWWQGRVTNTGATETGEDVLVDQHYQKVASLKAKDGWVLTLHEFLVEGEDAWVTANKNIPMDLSKYGGAYNGALVDSAVQEYNLRTGKLIRNWDALDHIPLSEAQATLPTNGFPWDAYHVNAIQLLGGGRFLVSMRNTWAAYLVNAQGKIEWTLGGRDSSFKFGNEARFEWQHDVRLQNANTVTLFDDHCCQLTGGGTYVEANSTSRGLELHIDPQAHTATLAAQYKLNGKIEVDYMGDTQPLQGGNVFVGWGSEPYFSEFSSSGKLLYEGELPGPDLTYRATVQQWTGEPISDPAGAARTSAGSTTVYASWNGATQVSSWRVLGGSSVSDLTTVAGGARTGFETAIRVPRSEADYEVQALDAKGRVIGASRPFAR